MSLDKIKSIATEIKAKSVELDQAIYEYQQTIPAKGEAQPVVEAAQASQMNTTIPAPVAAPQTLDIAPTATPAPETATKPQAAPETPQVEITSPTE